MDLLDVMLKRRSVRKYTDEEIPTEKLNKIYYFWNFQECLTNIKTEIL